MASLNVTKRWFSLLVLVFCTLGVKAQAPANDDCSNAELINIPNAGYGAGTFVSSTIDLTSATIQAGETFAPALSAAGLDKKSAWLRFTIASIRDVRITLTQPGSAIQAGDVGFTVYRTSGCLPSTADISPKLTSITTFGNTYNPCVPPGDYLVQVSAKSIANGPVNISVETNGVTGAAYDHPAGAYVFGVAGNFARKTDFDGGCHSTDDASEVCPLLPNSNEYYKTAWFTFTTPAYFDYIMATLSSTTGFFVGGGPGITKKFGFRLYRGDAVTTPVSALTIVDECDSMVTDGYHAAIKKYICGALDANTTYSIQLFIHKDFSEVLRMGLLTGGTAATVAPQPVTGIAPSHALGNITVTTTGSSSYMIGYFGCNSRHSNSACNPAIPAGGINIGGHNYNLSSFGTFTLPTTADVVLKPELPVCGPRPVLRLFRQSLTANCADLSLGNLVGTIVSPTTFNCLAPGDYVLQILGIDSAINMDTVTYKSPMLNTNTCLYSNLGGRYVATITAYIRKAIDQYSLNSTNMYDSINAVSGVMQTMIPDVTYTSLPDTFGCSPTLRPADTSCYPGADRIMYREFIVPDSGTVAFETLLDPRFSPILYKAYRGDAGALASAQNIFNYPDTISGLVANTECINGRTVCNNKSMCVVPGIYTFTTLGKLSDIGTIDQPSFTFKLTRTLHNSPSTAQDMGSVMDTVGTAGGDMMSDIDTWSCNDNAVPVNGYEPCSLLGRPVTKAIYRQFYLKEPSLIKIASENKGDCAAPFGRLTLFRGKATDGLDALDTVGYKWSCFNTRNSPDECEILPAGWYTVISWATGPNYDSTMRLLNAEARYNSYITYPDQITITIIPDCRGPQFNRPYKASVQANGDPHFLHWFPAVQSTPPYPITFYRDTLPTEYFNCTADTPFSSHRIINCMEGMTKVAYYVFKIDQVSFLSIDTKGLWGKVFNKDIRTDSLQFDTLHPVQECIASGGYLQLCNLQPGVYTLALFASDANRCMKVTPAYYIDSVGYSRFDFAQNAYDFGVVPPDSLFHDGKAGEVNPIMPGRAASSDFIYCTTGAFNFDPGYSSCSTVVNGNIYSPLPNQQLYGGAFPETPGYVARRNLWYTFVGGYPGTYTIKVKNMTQGRDLQPQFAVFASDVDGSLPFSTVQANGLVDSTLAQGLQYIDRNYKIGRFIPPCAAAPDAVSFFRPACDLTPTRYYVLVDNVFADDAEPGGLFPNSQIDVSILIDSLDRKLTVADHYYQAQDIPATVAGVYTGPKDNYACATRDATDPLYTGPNTCNKTLWYTFNCTMTGSIRYRIHVDTTLASDSGSIKLYRQTITGDSTLNGLKLQTPEFVDIASGRWQEVCISPGTYYFLLPGCGRSVEFVYPEIELIETQGDICSNAVPVVISGPGSVSNSLKVTCHTIGTDYGEFGPTLTCPQGANTADYKTSWFRIDVTGTDTLDITTYLTENTNAASDDIKYRLMTGDCSAMQEQSCVQDALTQNTYQCLLPSQSYYLQVITPLVKNGLPVKGTVSLVTSATAHTDTCAPLTNCLALANFTSSFDCRVSDKVNFANYSTFGTSITYNWNFGYNNQVSTDVSPSFLYPALSHDSTYNVRLIVSNTGCGKADTIIKPVLVTARILADLGTDITACDSAAQVILRTPAHSGATYVWQDGSSADTFAVTATGSHQYYVTVTYNGCTGSDTIQVFKSPLKANPLKRIVLCNGTVSISGERGIGETYTWNTAATTASINVGAAGYYWVDVSYGNCTYRDSFEIVTISNTGNILPPDTSICFSRTDYIIRSGIRGADRYSWQDGSTADTLLVSSPGQYHVAISISGCMVRDTMNIGGFPAVVLQTTDTAICNGTSLLLPWGTPVSNAGTFKDTLVASTGCDSLVRIWNVSIKPKPDLGADTSIHICSGNSIDLNTVYNTGSNTNRWSSGSSIIPDVSAINAAGRYQLITITPAGCSDTVEVSIVVDNKPVLVVHDPAVICSTNTTDITAAAITAGSSAGIVFSYWLDAAGTTAYNTPAAAKGGTYYIKGSSANGCFDIKAVTVATFPVPAVTAGNDFAICDNDSARLNAVVTNNFSPVVYSWQPVTEGGIRSPAAAASIVKPAGTQLFIITVTDSCQVTAADSILVTVQPPVPAFAGNDTIAPTGQPHQLRASGGVNYLWQPAGLLNNNAIANPVATILADSVLFTVIVTDEEGCTGYDTVKIRTYNGITYYVPNAFSPDGNNMNDIFRPVPVGIVATDYFRIYNRYGQLVFETSQLNKGWDGTFKGKAQQTGNYVWVLKGRGSNGKSIEMKGNVLLIR